MCRYLKTHPQLDRLLQHTLTMFAGWMLFEELESTASLSLRSSCVEQFAVDSPGRPAALEAEHWTLALLAAPEIKLTMRGAKEQQ